jgi:hypothetical protein
MELASTVTRAARYAQPFLPADAFGAAEVKRYAAGDIR